MRRCHLLPTFKLLRHHLAQVISDKDAQGHVVDGLGDRLDALPDSYDALADFAHGLRNLPLRDGWPYIEPSDLDGIWSEAAPDRPTAPMTEVDPDDAARRVEAAFLGSATGCMLGKPLEAKFSLKEIRSALEAIGEWPLDAYVPERIMEPLGRLHRSWPETVREQIQWVAPDDDINYTVMGMLILERHGRTFSHEDLRSLWLEQLPMLTTFGPERTMMAKSAVNALPGGDEGPVSPEWVEVLNPNDEMCGAMIRADAYGYACPGDPASAAELAWRDASFTHRRTGIYGTMFAAASIALALTPQAFHDRLEIFETALKLVPRRSRFYERTSDCLEQVREASDWLDGYERIHSRYHEFDHCKIYQETGTLMNTLRFAKSTGHGICLQVMQGNDTDSYGATAGSMLGAFFGPGGLEERWTRPFNDTIHTALANFHEGSLSRLAARMAELPRRISG